MRPSALISLALLLGALAVFLVARWVGLGGTRPQGPRVVVTAVAVEAGLPLAAQHLQVLHWPTQTAPQGAFDSADKVLGRVLRQAVVAGEPLLESRLAPVNVKGGLSATLETGQRAITVRVNDVIGVAGFALPGTFVDVLVSARDSSNEPFSKIVLNRVRILAVAQETVSDPAKPKVVSAVTLELTPAESERLDLARSVGSLSLALRNELDRSPPTSAGTRLADLMRLGPALPGALATPVAQTVRARAVNPSSSATSSASSSSPVEELRGMQSSSVAGAGAAPGGRTP